MESTNNMEERKIAFETTKLVRADKLNRKLFDVIDKDAEKVIISAKPQQLLLLRITMNSPLKLIEAKPFDKTAFEALLKQ